VYAYFRSRGFTVEKYCRHKHLNPRWFDGQLAECDELNGEVEKEETAVEHVEYDRKKADKNKNLNGRVSIPDHLNAVKLSLICRQPGRYARLPVSR